MLSAFWRAKSLRRDVDYGGSSPGNRDVAQRNPNVIQGPVRVAVCSQRAAGVICAGVPGTATDDPTPT